jgi:hypothetical protein
MRLHVDGCTAEQWKDAFALELSPVQKENLLRDEARKD